MGTSNGSAAYIQRRSEKLIDPERLSSHGCTDDIYNCVGGTDFVEVDLLHVDVVHRCFGRAQRQKDFAGNPAAVLADGSRSDDS